ncbi:hypothetical protein HaLaN_29230, partial [Haematococcus lacustris]
MRWSSAAPSAAP